MKFEGKEFNGQTITLDFNEFVGCKFKDCDLTYHGFGLVGLSNCSFDDVRWGFDGPAANTVKFMTGIYRGAGEGGRKIIDATFENIKKGVFPKPGTN